MSSLGGPNKKSALRKSALFGNEQPGESNSPQSKEHFLDE
jgi:hypothetical protein